MKQLVYITGSGHSGSTLLDRLLGSHPEIAALGEIHRFSLGLHRSEKPFRCDCGKTISECEFWSDVLDKVSQNTGRCLSDLIDNFQTTDHSVLAQPSGENYFNATSAYRFLPSRLDKYFLAITPKKLTPILERLGALGQHLRHARGSHALFQALADVSGVSTVIDSTKNPMRMRALYLTSPYPLRVIYLRRDGRAVASSRMRRQSIGMDKAAKIWFSENRKVRLVLRAMKGVDILNVNYEDLCYSPDQEMKRIFRFLDLHEAPVNLDAVRHAIGGNPSRFNVDKSVVVDERWRSELTEADLDTFERIAGKEARLKMPN